MAQRPLVLYEDDHRRLLGALQRLVREATAKGVFLVDRNGQLLAESGEMNALDTTSLASLAAGNVAATGGLARLIGEDEFPTHFHQGERDHLHVTIVARRVILLVVFDERSSLGLVRLRARRTSLELARIIEEIEKRSDSDQPSASSPFAEITDEDIDNLFAD